MQISHRELKNLLKMISQIVLMLMKLK